MRKTVLISIIFLLAAILRFYNLEKVPPSLYWDEASLGYNAYSILKTGKDEHGVFLPITNFAAYGDYKPPLYIYLTVPSIALFGLSEFAIRFPSALFGLLTVAITYLLARKIFEDERALKFGKLEADIPTIAAFLLAISPWHLQFSRGAFEANVGLFFSTLGIYLFFKFAKDNQIWILPSLMSFLAGMYTFTGQRLFVPLILILLFVQFRKNVLNSLKIVITSLVIFGLIFYPLFIFATQTLEGRLRFQEVTIFNNLDPINDSIRLRSEDHFVWWANIIHNRRFHRAGEYISHYFDAFNPRFLFTKGDVNPRLSIQDFGHLYYFEIFTLALGTYFLLARKQKFAIFLLGWLLVSPMGPATARETPHALRMIHILPTFQLISAYGIVTFLTSTKHKKLFSVILGLAVFICFSFYIFNYYFHYGQNYSRDWQYGYKQAVETIKPLYNQADTIIVDKSLGRPYIYFLIYLKVDPANFQKSGIVVKDKFYFLDVLGFDKLKFTDVVDFSKQSGKVLFVTTSKPPETVEIVNQINDLNGNPTFFVSKKGFQ
ncbi:glycosyltransferase family 39 protein [Candidatus Curtissbacteria bacterium]|nr:glycosyltransferase family 39 protein [Candidatus Curtissbacteria bacterium]